MGRYAAKKKQDEDKNKKKATIPSKRNPPAGGPPLPKTNKTTGKPNTTSKKNGDNRFKPGGKSNFPTDAPGDLSKTKPKPKTEKPKTKKESAKDKAEREAFERDQAEFEKKLDQGMKKKKEREAAAKAAKKKPAAKKSEPKRSNVFTRHYKTGKALGVMTKRQRDAYDKEAAAAGGKSYEERVAAHEKESGHGKKHLRETLYNASQRKGSKQYKEGQARKATAKAAADKKAADRVAAAKKKAAAEAKAKKRSDDMKKYSGVDGNTRIEGPKKSTTKKPPAKKPPAKKPPAKKPPAKKGPSGKINLPGTTKTNPGLTDPNANIAKLTIGSKTRKRTKRRA